MPVPGIIASSVGEMFPFPMGLFKGIGPVVLRREGTSHQLMQDHGKGDWTVWHISSFTERGYTSQALTTCNLVATCSDVSIANIVRGGTWAGSSGPPFSTNVVGNYAEWTVTGSILGWVAGYNRNRGLCVVSIDGDTTTANLLETAESLVQRGMYPDTILVSNGGTLQPTDRCLDSCLDTTSTSTVYRPTIFARNLEETAHTVRLTVTGYKRAAAPDNLLSYDDFTPILVGTGTTPIGAVGTRLVEWASLYNPKSTTEVATTISGIQVGGPSHGYEELIDIEYFVDGSPVSLNDGDVVTGTSITAHKLAHFHYPTLTPPAYLADLRCDYQLNRLGLELGIDLEFKVTSNQASSYMGMMPFEPHRADARQGHTYPSTFPDNRIRYGSGSTLPLNQAGLKYINSLPTTATMWNAEMVPTQAAVCWWGINNQSLNGVYVLDRTQLDKLYPTVPSTPVTIPANTVWRSSCRYMAKPFADPNALFGS